MLEDIVSILDDGSYPALVIAGDVYDRSIPSPEAVDLFGYFLGKVKSLKRSPEVLVIPGNHDSASRLGFGRELFSRLGIRFGVSAGDCDKPVIVERDGEGCAFFLLPFLNPGVLSAEESSTADASGDTGPLRSQAALAEEAARRMEKARLELFRQRKLPSVLAAHLFACGGSPSDSERVFLGSAELVNAGIFSGFDYIALGHLHRCQHIGEKAWYAGSPLAYSFGEPDRNGQGKFFLSVELNNGGTMVEKIPVRPLRKVTSLSGPFSRFTGEMEDDAELRATADDYLEIRLSDRGITENAGDILRKRFPRLLSLKQDTARAGLSNTLVSRAAVSAGNDNSNRRFSEDFGNFLSGLYGETNREEIDLFNKILEEAEKEEALS